MKEPVSVETIPPLVRDAFDPDIFRQTAHQMVDMLTDHLQSLVPNNSDAIDPPVSKTLDWDRPQDMIKQWKTDPPAGFAELAQKVMANSIRLHHPNFVGHQISPPAPIAATFSFLVDLLNNGMGIFEMGMAGTAIEQIVIEMLVDKFGLPAETAGGFMTSGGSLANLTAMLAARSIVSDDDVWNRGNQKQYAVLVSSAAHYCMDRAARIMGWGQSGVIQIPVNDQFQMRTDLLESQLEQARQRNIEVLAVVGSACCTATGSYDDLSAIGHFCRRHDLWFHVDGAHGAAVAFSPTHRGLLRGIEMADSITLDFHKMLMTPALASALVFRRNNDSFQTFAQKAEYIWADESDETDDATHYDLAKRTFECTKQMFALKFYAVWQCLGESTLAANIDHLFQLSQHFSDLVNEASDFELAMRPQSNIICFRYTDADPDTNLCQWNETLRRMIVEDGTYYIVQTRLNGKSWLRVTIGNSLTTPLHLAGLLEHIRQLAQHHKKNPTH